MVTYLARLDGRVRVQLTREEFEFCKAVGIEERRLAIARHSRNSHGYDPSDEQGERSQWLGHVCEGVVAKFLGLPVSVVRSETYAGADLPFNVEVRLVGGNHYGLRVRPCDEDSRRVVGVYLPRGEEDGPSWIVGWLNAKHAKRPEWLIQPHWPRPPFYAVPQRRLHFLDSLLSVIERDRVASLQRRKPGDG